MSRGDYSLDLVVAFGRGVAGHYWTLRLHDLKPWAGPPSKSCTCTNGFSGSLRLATFLTSKPTGIYIIFVVISLWSLIISPRLRIVSGPKVMGMCPAKSRVIGGQRRLGLLLPLFRGFDFSDNPPETELGRSDGFRFKGVTLGFLLSQLSTLPLPSTEIYFCRKLTVIII